MKLMEQVRDAISNSHDQIELTPFSKALMSDFISARDYARGISQLWHVHNLLEKIIPDSTRIAEFFSDEMVRTMTLRRDLHALGFCVEAFEVMPETSRILRTIEQWASDAPFALLGCIYILEGSRMGSLVIAKQLAKALGLASGNVRGIEYHTEGASGTPARVRALKSKIDSAELGEVDSAAVLTGSVEFMNQLTDLYRALPVTSRPGSDSSGGSKMCPHGSAHDNVAYPTLKRA